MSSNHYFKDENVVDFMMDLTEVPVISKIELSSACQLRCVGCPTGSRRSSKDDFVSLDLVRKIVDNNWLRSTSYVELMMSGEATLHPKFDEVVDILKTSGVMLGVSTNLVDRNKILSLCKLDSITVSMDVFDQEGYELSRPPMKFDRLIANIEELVANAPSTTLIYLQLLRTEFTEKYFLASIPKAQAFIDSLGVHNVVLRYVSDCFSGVMGREDEQLNSRMCLTPHSAVVIKHTGTVHPCGYCFTGKEEGLLLGDLNTQSLEEVWVGDMVKKLRKAHQTQENLPLRCRQCKDGNRSNHIFQHSLCSDIIRHRNGIKII